MTSYTAIVNLVLIGATALVSMLALNNPDLMRRLILWPPAIARSKEYYRLVSYGFIHADGGHLLFNMITLYFFGGTMERFFELRFGMAMYPLFYFGGLVVSILPSYFENRNNPGYHSLGASGAVSAALFASILLQPWTTILVFFVPMPAILYAVLYIVYSLYMERRGGDNVNHMAHLWGAAYGVAFTAIAEPRVLSAFIYSVTHPGLR